MLCCLFCGRVLFLVLCDYFRIFGESVVVEWVLDLFTKVKHVGFLYGVYMFSFFRAFSVSIMFAIAPRVCFVSSFGRTFIWCFYVIYVFIISLS